MKRNSFLKKFCFLVLVLLVCNSLQTQKSDSITLKLLDSVTLLPVIDVYVFDAKNNIVSLSNEQGVIKLAENTSRYWITSHVAYVEDTIFAQDLPLNGEVNLAPSNNAISTISVTAKRRRTSGSIATLDESDIKSVPALFGEADPLRAALRIAGVESGGEANSRLHIRGGLPGENLTLLDGVPIYNETHVGPLFSVFNADVLKSFTVHKIAAPLEKGSGISALLDATTKLPSFTERDKKLSIGPINTGFYMNGPWRKSERTAVAIGLRAAPLSLISLFSKNNLKNGILPELADVNLSLRHQLPSGAEIIARAFWTHDALVSAQEGIAAADWGTTQFRERFTVGWNNQGHSLNYVHPLKNSWSLNTLLHGARFNYFWNEFSEERDEFTFFFPTANFNVSGGINDFGIRLWSERISTGGRLVFGLNAKQLTSTPATVEDAETPFPVLSDIRRSQRLNLFVSWDRKLGNRTRLSLGGQLNNYWSDGYAAYLPTGYLSLENKMTNELTTKLTVERIAQFEHALPSFGGAWQLNTWLLASEVAPASAANKAELSVNYSLGSFIEVSQAAYYREAYDLVRTTSEDFIQLLDDDTPNVTDCCVAGGRGTNYGLETSLTYRRSTLEIGLNYTIARSRHTFERINGGRPFSPRFDRRHSVNFWLSKSLRNDGWRINTQFIYQSGIAYTAPVAQIPDPSGEVIIPIYDGINNARFPAVHRLDLGVDRNWIGRNGHRNTVSFGVYNLLNQANASYFQFQRVRGLDREGKFPIAQPARQAQVEGVFGIYPYVSFRKEFAKR
ncbi:hypothetical protein CEQ90_07845 [Lewinellaceae bacterium SD302]|nr:hypothetical protein CEQ90_07845 [Lewinellaceae bacterium SD302]